MVYPLSLLLFGGGRISFGGEGGQETVTLDDEVTFKCPVRAAAPKKFSFTVALHELCTLILLGQHFGHLQAKTRELVMRLRTELDHLLQRKIEQPAMDLSKAGDKLMHAIIDLIGSEVS